MERSASAATRARSRSAPAGRPASRRSLVGLDLAAFPYREVVSLENRSVEDSARIARRTLTELGFHVGGGGSSVPAPTGPDPPGTAAPLVILGERNLATDTTDPATIATLAIVLGGGGVLGVIDGFITRNWIAIPAWLAGFGLIAALLWVAFGRSYRSDVVVALIDVDASSPRPPGSPDGAARSIAVTWLAGRVRSELRAAPSPDTRRVARVGDAYGVIGALASVIRTFRGHAEGRG